MGQEDQRSPTAAKEKVLGPAAAPMTMTTVVVTAVVVVVVVMVVEDGKGERERERDGENEAQERRGESSAQRGPVRRCMADLETRSPQGETRGPKRRPRRIDRNSRES